MTRDRKTPADIRREALALQKPVHPEALLSKVEGPVEGAPNALPSAVEGMREFGLNACPEHSRGDEYARTRRLSRARSRGHPPSALPSFPKCARPPVVWPGDNPFPIPPGLRMPGQGRGEG